MTTATDERVTLPLKRPAASTLVWLVVLALGIPVGVVAYILVVAYGQGAPAAPVLVSTLLILVVAAGVTLWIARMILRAGVVLDGDALIVDAGIATQRFAIASLRANGVRVVELASEPELKPVIRTWGIGLPGFASGWFRLRNGGKALCVLTARERVTVLRDGGTWILLSLVETSTLRRAVEDGGLKPTL